MWERGLKLNSSLAYRNFCASLPMWERGLKQDLYDQLNESKTSLPMWERGLKHTIATIKIIKISRSPCGSVD